MPKTWFVTGASRGLGAEIVRVAVRGGNQVIVAARNPTVSTVVATLAGMRLSWTAGVSSP
jgi:NAD(P)-dependent dehydrogenase (short-subunit alcohol dehydrogenase family)